MAHNDKAVDLRIQRTRMALRNALIELTTERGFAALTVQDIAERAMVNRATFYRHYQDKYDLVISIVKEVLAELEAPEQHWPRGSEAGTLNEPAPGMVRLFEHIAAHAAFYRVMLGKDTFSLLDGHVRAYVEHVMRQRLQVLGYDPQRARLPFDLCMSAMVSTALGMIKWWLEHDLPFSPHQMAIWLPQFNMLGLQYGLGLDARSSFFPIFDDDSKQRHQ